MLVWLARTRRIWACRIAMFALLGHTLALEKAAVPHARLASSPPMQVQGFARRAALARAVQTPADPRRAPVVRLGVSALAAAELAQPVQQGVTKIHRGIALVYRACKVCSKLNLG